MINQPNGINNGSTSSNNVFFNPDGTVNRTGNTGTPETTSGISDKKNNPYVNPDGILGKDDFMKLMLIELQYQDPTEPMDTEKILQQTSELASLEAADNTKKALEELSKSFANSQQYAVLSAIGKMASVGSGSIEHVKGESSMFEMYFPTDVKNGTMTISDEQGNTVKTIELQENAKGIYSFEWDGTDNNGNLVDDGLYKVSATYYDPDGDPQKTSIGSYPIESVRFENGKALLKLGSQYIPLDEVNEIF